MTASQKAELAEMDIIPMLEKVFRGEIPEMPAPSGEIGADWKQRGIITSCVSRQFYSLLSIVDEHYDALIAAHNRLHRDSCLKGQDHDCMAFKQKLVHMHIHREVLRELFWQSITDEYPQAAANALYVMKDWALVSKPKEEWYEDILIPDAASPLRNVTGRIGQIISRRELCTVEITEDNEPAKKGETILGVLEDDRVKSFRYLLFDLQRTLRKMYPPDLDRSTVEKMTIKEFERLKKITDWFEGLIKTLNALFWVGVRDSIPAARYISVLGICRGWKVVERVEEKLDLGLLMTPTGPEVRIPPDVIKKILLSVRHPGR